MASTASSTASNAPTSPSRTPTTTTVSSCSPASCRTTAGIYPTSTCPPTEGPARAPIRPPCRHPRHGSGSRRRPLSPTQRRSTTRLRDRPGRVGYVTGPPLLLAGRRGDREDLSLPRPLRPPARRREVDSLRCFLRHRRHPAPRGRTAQFKIPLTVDELVFCHTLPLSPSVSLPFMFPFHFSFPNLISLPLFSLLFPFPFPCFVF